jgi:hypothetical protein
LANFPRKTWKKTDHRCTTSFTTTTTTARRNFTLAAISARNRPFTLALYANPLSFFLSRSRHLQLATVIREPEGNGRELRVLTAHPMADSSLALPLLDNFLSPVLSHWEEFRA